MMEEKRTVTVGDIACAGLFLLRQFVCQEAGRSDSFRAAVKENARRAIEQAGIKLPEGFEFRAAPIGGIGEVGNLSLSPSENRPATEHEREIPEAAMRDPSKIGPTLELLMKNP